MDKYLRFFREHERLLVWVFILGTVGFLGNKYLNKSYDSAVARQQAAAQVLSEQVSKNNELQKNVDSLQQKYGQLLDTLTRQNATLIASISTRNAVVVGQQKTDASLGLPELAARQQTLVGTTGISSSSTENGLLESPAAAVAVTQSLELLPVLKQDNQDLQTISGNKDSQITSLNGVVTGLSGQVDGLKLQLTDSSKACDARVAVARKSRWKWFKAGAAVGFVAGVLTGHYL